MLLTAFPARTHSRANENPITLPQTPFASAKNSGIEQSINAIEHYARLKNVSVKLD